MNDTWRNVSCKSNRTIDVLFNDVVKLDLTNMDGEQIDKVKGILITAIDQSNRTHWQLFEAWETRWLQRCPLELEQVKGVKNAYTKTYPHGD